MVEAQAGGGVLVTPATAAAPETHGSTQEWLEARCRGSGAPGYVILHAPSFAFQSPGGGENQLVQSGRHLEELGIPIRLFSAWTDRLEAARLLHLFGMSREGLELARVAKARRIPVVLSPICWYEPRAMAELERGAIRKARSLTAWAVRLVWPGAELAVEAAGAGRSGSAQFPVRSGSAHAALRGKQSSDPGGAQRCAA